MLITFVKRLKSETIYFIQCDLIDKERNLFNGKKSDVLALFDIKGKPFKKVTYHGSPQQVLRERLHYRRVYKCITICGKDEKGKPFDFKGFPLVFELELN